MLLLARITIRPSPTESWVRRAITSASAAVVPCSLGARLLKITDTPFGTGHRAMVSNIANDAPVREVAGEPETTPHCLLEELTNTLTRATGSIRRWILSNLLRMKVAVFWCNRVGIPQAIEI